jgi:predicted HTH transcriptional regulator
MRSFCSKTFAPTTQVANRRMVGPLLGLAEDLRNLIDERNTVVELLAGLHRVQVPLIPSVTRREAVANALRCYPQRLVSGGRVGNLV